jgi:type I restriction enzyme R subunit
MRLVRGVKTPEQEARDAVDAQLERAGWIVQNRDKVNLAAGRGVAIREFKMAEGHGYADYLQYVDKHKRSVRSKANRSGSR